MKKNGKIENYVSLRIHKNGVRRKRRKRGRMRKTTGSRTHTDRERKRTRTSRQGERDGEKTHPW